jgi:hypothetical protein
VSSNNLEQLNFFAKVASLAHQIDSKLSNDRTKLCAHLLESMRIPFQAHLDRFVPICFVGQCVETVLAIATVTKFAIGEAVTVQFQALRLGAVARPFAGRCKATTLV